MRHIESFILISILSLLFVKPCVAQEKNTDAPSLEKIEHALLNDCDKALDEFDSHESQFSHEDKIVLTQYIQRILQMRSSSERAFTIKAPSSSPYVGGSSIADTLDPNIEIEAKLCAFNLAEKILPISARILGETLKLALDPRTPKALKKKATQIAYILQSKVLDKETNAETEKQILKSIDSLGLLKNPRVFLLVYQLASKYEENFSSLIKPSYFKNSDYNALISTLASSKHLFRNKVIAALHSLATEENSTAPQLYQSLARLENNKSALIKNLPNILSTAHISNKSKILTTASQVLSRKTNTVKPVLLSDRVLKNFRVLFGSSSQEEQELIGQILLATSLQKNSSFCKKDFLKKTLSSRVTTWDGLMVTLCPVQAETILQLTKKISTKKSQSIENDLTVLIGILSSHFHELVKSNTKWNRIFDKRFLRTLNKLTRQAKKEGLHKYRHLTFLIEYLLQKTRHQRRLTPELVLQLFSNNHENSLLRSAIKENLKFFKTKLTQALRKDPRLYDLLLEIFETTGITNKTDLKLILPLLVSNDQGIRLRAIKLLHNAQIRLRVKDVIPSKKFIPNTEIILFLAALESDNRLSGKIPSTLKIDAIINLLKFNDDGSVSHQEAFTLLFSRLSANSQKELINSFSQYPLHLSTLLKLSSSSKSIDDKIYRYALARIFKSKENVDAPLLINLANIRVNSIDRIERVTIIRNAVNKLHISTHGEIILKLGSLIDSKVDFIPHSLLSKMKDKEATSYLRYLSLIYSKLHSPESKNISTKELIPLLDQNDRASELTIRFPFSKNAQTVLENELAHARFTHSLTELSNTAILERFFSCMEQEISSCNALEELLPDIYVSKSNLLRLMTKRLSSSCRPQQPQNQTTSSSLPRALTREQKILPSLIRANIFADNIIIDGKGRIEIDKSILICTGATKKFIGNDYLWNILSYNKALTP